MLAGAVLAESTDINVRGAGLGVIGGIVFTFVVIATIFLVRNMNMRIKRLPDEFESPIDDEAASPGTNSDGATAQQ